MAGWSVEDGRLGSFSVNLMARESGSRASQSARTPRGLTRSWASCILPRSMHARSVQSQNFIVILLVVAIPFCCCNFRSLLGGSLSCQADSLLNDRHAGDRLSPAVEHGRDTHACCHGKSLNHEGTPEPKPGNGPNDEPQDCSCDKSGGKMLSVEKPSIHAPAQVVVAILDWCTRPELGALNLASGRDPLHLAVQRPLTSLVRMHCALIV